MVGSSSYVCADSWHFSDAVSDPIVPLVSSPNIPKVHMSSVKVQDSGPNICEGAYILREGAYTLREGA